MGNQKAQEKVYTFGFENNLVGVMTERTDNKESNDLPAILLWNAGLLHRVGPHRLYVNLARRLAIDGFIVFRFDLSGLGDSEMLQRENRPEDERVASDIREAMRFVEIKKNKKQFILIGLCSGADNAHLLTSQDSRVVGAVFLDGFGYRTLKYYFYYYVHRLTSIRFWKKKMLQVSSLFRNYENIKAWLKNDIFTRDFPIRNDFKDELQQMINCNKKLFYVYTKGSGRYYNYQHQFSEMIAPIKLYSGVRIEYHSNADHTFSRLKDSDFLIRQISDWICHEFNGSY